MIVIVERLIGEEWKKHGTYKSVDEAIKEAFVLGEFGAARDVRAKVVAEDGRM